MLLNECIKLYEDEMEEASTPYIEPFIGEEKLTELHMNAKGKAMELVRMLVK